MSSHVSPVVVGYDFSHSGRAALHRAVTLAGRAPFHVLHIVCVVDPKEAIPSIPSYNGVDYMYAARVQEALAAEVQQELDQADVRGSVHFFVHARIGKAAEEILNLAREVGADLIIVGSKGMSGLERLILGSTSEQVVRDAGCTVEVARPKQYPEVELMAIEPVDPNLPKHTYVPPHRYTYEDHRVNLRPAEWPLY
ncbi:MAG: universal stress protein [Deltaproteobacteria bacterium]|nr:universal stress protein [Nannocystaceae bacterium]